ncbi:MAG TPA: hypothetical protein VMG12_15820 [Polyangiaceae bacterium]|nr:hypothetical protein [Polyangiaceae bacterium]
MSDASDLPQRVQLARELLAPSREQRERVRAGLAARADFRAPGKAPSAQPAKAVRWLGLAKGSALIGVGFALGYWFAETPAPEQALTRAEVRAAASGDVAGQAGAPSAGTTPEAAASASLDASASGASASGASAAGAPASGALATSGANDSTSSGAASNGAASSGAASASPSKPAVGVRRAHARAHSHADAADTTRASREELALLQRAERAIRAGDGALAHSFIDELEARFPKTIWREERAAVLVLAACTQGEPGASERARSFLARRSSSMYHDRITSLCRLADSAPLDTGALDGSPSGGHSSVRRKIP